MGLAAEDLEVDSAAGGKEAVETAGDLEVDSAAGGSAEVDLEAETVVEDSEEDSAEVEKGVETAVETEGVDLVAGATVVAGLVVETVETGMLGGRLRRQ